MCVCLCSVSGKPTLFGTICRARGARAFGLGHATVSHLITVINQTSPCSMGCIYYRPVCAFVCCSGPPYLSGFFFGCLLVVCEHVQKLANLRRTAACTLSPGPDACGWSMMVMVVVATGARAHVCCDYTIGWRTPPCPAVVSRYTFWRAERCGAESANEARTRKRERQRLMSGVFLMDTLHCCCTRNIYGAAAKHTQLLLLIMCSRVSVLLRSSM